MNIADLKRAAKEFNGTITGTITDKVSSYYVDAPEGYKWSCSGIHYLYLHWNMMDGKPLWAQEKQEAIADAIDRISQGIETCDDPDCDICNPDPE